MAELSDLSPVPLPKAPRLSKSKFLSGLQCHKRLYFEVHQPALATKPDAATQAMFDMGTEVGEFARWGADSRGYFRTCPDRGGAALWLASDRGEVFHKGQGCASGRSGRSKRG